MSSDAPTIYVSETGESTTTVDPSRVLFLGLGQSAVGWYRCYLPALFMGADWVGFAGEPGQWSMATGLVKKSTQMPNWDDYDIVVIQQPHGLKWLRLIKELQANGTKVLFEIDDYLHAIRKMSDHDFSDAFDKDFLQELELCMGVCDGLITSTEFISRMYGKHVGRDRTYVCRNGIDTARYRLTRPKRPSVNIGWAGATAHQRAIGPWLDSVSQVMHDRDEANFVTIGQNYADLFKETFPGRAISTPFSMIETYPSAMTMFDIALGPAGKNNFFRGKSDLRWLEAGALGVPIIADPFVYPEIEHGVNGFHAETPEEVTELLTTLIDDEELRTTVGLSAKAYVHRERDFTVMVKQWIQVFADVLRR